jgi:acetyl esterase
MPLDPDVKALLANLAAAGVQPAHVKSVAAARADLDRLITQAPKLNEPVGRVVDRTIPGPAGPVPVRVYVPQGSGPFRVLVYCHGGGFVLGSLAMYDDSCRALAHGSGRVVVSVDYRLAPEHPFPAGLEDYYAATLWAARNGAEIDGSGPVAVAGDSAGGNLAAAVALLARERGGPALDRQVLIYPVTDCSVNTPSYLEYGGGEYGLMRETMIWFWRHYLPAGADGHHPHASVLRADDLAGLPPALVLTAECDVLRDEGEAYLARLRAAGTPAVGIRYLGTCHGFFSWAGVFDAGRQALRAICDTLRAVP